MRIGRFAVRFRYPPKPDLLLVEVQRSPQLWSVCDDLDCEAYPLTERLIILRFRYVFYLLWFAVRTHRMAALLCARVRSQGIRVVVTMENHDKFNKLDPSHPERNNRRDPNRTLFDDVTKQVPELKVFLIQHGQELRRFSTTRSAKDVTLFCWGDWTARNFPMFGRNEKHFISVGALVDGLYRLIRPSVEVKDVSICLVSTVKGKSWWGSEIDERRKGYEQLAAYVHRFSTEESRVVNVALTIDRDQYGVGDAESERKWFLDRLGESIQFTEPSLLFGDQNFTDHGRQTPRYVKERYASYFLSDRAEMTLGMTSSVLWESFGRGNKVLAVNLTDNPIYDFPISGIWSMRQPSYEQFAARMRQLLAMPQHDWLELTREARFDLVAYREDAPPHVLINQHLRKVLDELR